MNFMIQEITCGVPKKDSVVPMTLEASEAWDKLEIEIADIKSRGLIVDCVFE